ncbi:hypothetical protein [Scytonema sp. NUACC26]|uniref:hypothetical protein n=1 Tax=Scytonema sp. NUACC26 TaxID=3140176 RepID=UPI0034DC7D5A
MRQTARLITTGTYSNGRVNVCGSSYPATLTLKVEELVRSGELNLSEKRPLILVPNTLHPSVFNYQDEQEPHLDFTIIGTPVNQDINELDMDIVKVCGKVIYENRNHGFILVKLQKGRNDQKIKLVGHLNNSATIDDYGNARGTAVDKYYRIEAEIYNKQLVIVDSYRIRENAQVLQFPQRQQIRYAA